MKKTITICDKCGKEISDGTGTTFMDEVDICQKCWPKLKAALFEWLNQQNDQKSKKKAEEKQDETTEKKPAEAPMKASAKDKVDLGKMQALRNAGWTVDKIADEMKVSKSFVYSNTIPPAKKKHYPNEFSSNEPVLDPLIRDVQEAKPGKEVAE